MTDAVPPAKAIEFKGTTLSVVSVILGSLDPATLEAALGELFGDNPSFFDNDAAVFDLTLVATEESANWPAIVGLLRRYSLLPLAVCNGSEALQASAQDAGLAPVEASALTRAGKKSAPLPVAAPVPAAAVEAVPAAPLQALPPIEANTLIIDKPLRSGQRVYARGGDLIVMSIVSAGAELIADGNIHVYAPLRGRALAGARGNSDARIFATCFEAELVSIAGVYRTFEQGIPAEFASKPTQVSLAAEKNGERSNILIKPLPLR